MSCQAARVRGVSVATRLSSPSLPAADAAVALLSGQEPDTGGTTIEDTESGRQVPAVLLDVQPIYKDNVKDVIDDDFVKVEDVCTPELADACAEAGLQ